MLSAVKNKIKQSRIADTGQYAASLVTGRPPRAREINNCTIANSLSGMCLIVVEKPERNTIAISVYRTTAFPPFFFSLLLLLFFSRLPRKHNCFFRCDDNIIVTLPFEIMIRHCGALYNAISRGLRGSGNESSVHQRRSLPSSSAQCC